MTSRFAGLLRERPISRPQARRGRVPEFRDISAAILSTERNSETDWIMPRAADREHSLARYGLAHEAPRVDVLPTQTYIGSLMNYWAMLPDDGRILEALDYGGFSPTGIAFSTRDATVGNWVSGLEARLSELRDAAPEEGIDFSSESENQLKAFLSVGLNFRRPAIFLLGNGNLRAVWENSGGEQVGLQFQGDDQIQFVLFARRRRDRLSHSAGKDTFFGVIEHVRAMKLMRLVAE